jgi:hypothetical protein
MWGVTTKEPLMPHHILFRSVVGNGISLLVAVEPNKDLTGNVRQEMPRLKNYVRSRGA